MRSNIFEDMTKDIMGADIGEAARERMLKNVMKLKEQKLNIMITGATGCGKSSTINAMFDMEVAKVGVGVDPETIEIEKYDMDNLVLWDTPGLGDGKEADNRHAKNIIRKLAEKDEDGNALIDLVLVILDGGTRDLGTSYELINHVIIPNLGKDKENRILVAINQADMAMKGRNWDFEQNRPNEQLVAFLEEKVVSIRERVYEATGVKIEPIYYSAGYKEEGGKQGKPYNLSKLLYYIVKATPSKKRMIYAQTTNKKKEMWEDNDELKVYGEEIRESIWDSIMEHASEGAEIGEEIGSIFGGVGSFVGKTLGGIIGGVVGIVKGLFGFF